MTLVIGVGNSGRGDDAAGLAVAALVAEAAPPGVTVRLAEGDPLALIDMWAGAADVYVVDAVLSGAAPGTVIRFDASGPLSAVFRHSGTHALGLADVIEVGRALDRLPVRLVGYGIEGAVFEPGTPLSAAARTAVPRVTRQLLRELTAGG